MPNSPQPLEQLKDVVSLALSTAQGLGATQAEADASVAQGLSVTMAKKSRRGASTPAGPRPRSFT